MSLAVQSATSIPIDTCKPSRGISRDIRLPVLLRGGSGVPSIVGAAYNLKLPPCFCHTMMAG
jgi:hypothetical protein